MIKLRVTHVYTTVIGVYHDLLLLRPFFDIGVDEDEELISLLDSENKFLTGLLVRFIEFLDKNNIEYETDDRRKFLDTSRFSTTDPNILSHITLYPFQINSIDTIIENKRGIVKMGTGCFVDDTKISLLNGTEVPISDLVKDQEYWVYGCKPSGEVIPTKVKALGITRQDNKYCEVTLDNDEVVKCTTDHLFMLRDGTYKRADELVEGESLMPLYRRISEKDDRIQGYEIYLDNSDGKEWYTHQTIGFDINKDQISKCWSDIKDNNKSDKYLIIHHKDFNKRNNEPSNLPWMGEHDHWKLHSKYGGNIFRRLNNNSEFVKKKIEFNKNHPNKRDDITIDKIDEQILLGKTTTISIANALNCSMYKIKCVVGRSRDMYWIEYIQTFYPEYHSSGGVIKNHRIKSVNIIQSDILIDFYDLNSPYTNNFALTAGIFVHNSGKTECAAAIVKLLDYPQTIFIANKIYYLEQGYKRFIKAGIPEDKLGYMDGSEVSEFRSVMFCSLQTMHSYLFDQDERFKRILDETQILIFDEAHHSSCMSGYRVITALTNASIRIGLTATPFKTRDCSSYHDYLMTGLFGEILVNIPSMWLRARGYLAEIDIHMIKLTKKPKGFLNNSDWLQVYKNGIVSNTEFNELVVKMAFEYLKSKRNILMLVKEINHGRTLLKMFYDNHSHLVIFSSGGGKFQIYNGIDYEDIDFSLDQVKEKFGENGYIIIGSQIYNEAIDIPEIDVIVYCSSARSLIQSVQIPGRGSRNSIGKDKCIVVDFMHTYSYILKNQALERIETYEDEHIPVTIYN